MVTRITELERMTTISLVDHFMTDMIPHRFSLTTLDNDIADHRAFILYWISTKKKGYGEIAGLRKKIDYEALQNRGICNIG
jgi:hypothetical protein